MTGRQVSSMESISPRVKIALSVSGLTTYSTPISVKKVVQNFSFLYQSIALGMPTFILLRKEGDGDRAGAYVRADGAADEVVRDMIGMILPERFAVTDVLLQELVGKA